MSWSGCRTYTVVSADQAETFLKKGQLFTVPDDGVYMNDARYQRYRRAVADGILKLSPKTQLAVPK